MVIIFTNRIVDIVYCCLLWTDTVDDEVTQVVLITERERIVMQQYNGTHPLTNLFS